MSGCFKISALPCYRHSILVWLFCFMVSTNIGVVVLVSGCLGLFQNVWVSMFTVSGFLVATEDKKDFMGE